MNEDEIDLDLSVLDPDFQAAVENRLFLMRVAEEASRRRDKEIASAAAYAWRGTRGDRVRRTRTAPPEVLEFAPGRYAFYRGKYHNLFGPPDSAKTWVVYIAAAQELARGNAVALTDYEMGQEAIIERLALLAVTDDQLRRLLILEPDRHLVEAGQEELVAAVEDLGAPLGLFSIDSQDESIAIAGLDPLSSVGVALWIADLPRFACRQWPSAAVIGIDHTPVSTTSRPAGSQRKTAGVDVMLSVRNLSRISQKSAGYSDVTVTRDRMGHHDRGELLFRLHGGGGQEFVVRELTGAEKSAADDDAIRERILALLADLPEAEFMTVAAVKRAIGGNGAHVGGLLTEMAKPDGPLEKVPGKGVRLRQDG